MISYSRPAGMAPNWLCLGIISQEKRWYIFQFGDLVMWANILDTRYYVMSYKITRTHSSNYLEALKHIRYLYLYTYIYKAGWDMSHQARYWRPKTLQKTLYEPDDNSFKNKPQAGLQWPACKEQHNRCLLTFAPHGTQSWYIGILERDYCETASFRTLLQYCSELLLSLFNYTSM